MHARIDQLLSLRDGEPVDAAVARHVEECTACADSLSNLVRNTGALRQLPQLDAPAASWQRIRATMDGPIRRHDHRPTFAIAAGVIAVLAISLAFIAGRENAVVADDETQVNPPVITVAGPELQALVERSRQLEGVLQDLPERPRIERVSTAATIDTLEQRIQWLDFQLSNGPDIALSDKQAQQLWSERVTLMDSLVKVRSAEAQRVSF